MLSYLIPRRQPAGKVRCGLLNTGELCVIDVHGNVQTYTVDSTRTIRERILQFENVQFVRVVDTLDADEVVMLQLTPDVVQIVIGEDTQTIQWDVHGGMQINYKVMNILVPLIRAIGSQVAGIYHMS